MRRGEIWWASLPPPMGAAPGYRRPVVVIQDDDFNESRIQTVVCVAITSNLERARAPGNLNVSFAFVEGEAMMMAIKDVAVSSGSACTSASLEPSYVLRAMGVGEELAHSSIRFGIGRFNTDEEIDYVAELVIASVRRLREMSPLYEMAKEGIDIKGIDWAQNAHV